MVDVPLESHVTETKRFLLLSSCPSCTLIFDASMPLFPGKDSSQHAAMGSHRGLTVETWSTVQVNFWKAHGHWLLTVGLSLGSSASYWQNSLHNMIYLTIILTITIHAAAATKPSSSNFSPGQWLCSKVTRTGTLASPVSRKMSMLHLVAQVYYWGYPCLVFLLGFCFVLFCFKAEIPSCCCIPAPYRVGEIQTERSKRFAINSGTFMFFHLCSRLQFTDFFLIDQLYKWLKCIRKIFPSGFSNPTP